MVVCTSSFLTASRRSSVWLTVSLVTSLVLTWTTCAYGDSKEPAADKRTFLSGRRVRVVSKEAPTYQSSTVKQTQEYKTYRETDARRNPSNKNSRTTQRPEASSWRRPISRSEKPNILLILTDDQDVLLGSLKYMPKVQNLLIRTGVYFNNSFVTTPMCCPSRSSLLTGTYVHNHNVYTNNDNCSSTDWQQQFEPRTFATYINRTYTTGYFGKYLNEYNGSYTPPGWHRWVGLIKNSRFYNYSLVDETGVKVRHGDNYYADYLTDLVTNSSRSFFRESKMKNPSKPVMMVLSVPAPHGPEDAAPQYQHMFVNNTDHRTPSWNHAPNPDKQWLLQNVYPMTPQHKIFTDLLQRRRLQTLQSVDDLVENIVQELDMLGELDNTYIVYTSDHGYHLGQFGLIKGKAMPFDFDTRVPLIIRGPGIRPGTIISNIVSNVDIAPTLIDMAGEQVPENMDGDSIMKLIRAASDQSNVDRRGFVGNKKMWRDTILLERGKLTENVMKQRMRTERDMIKLSSDMMTKGMQFYSSAHAKKMAECSKEEYKLPCKPLQKWYCAEENGHLRKLRCQHKSVNVLVDNDEQRDLPLETEKCLCQKKKIKKGIQLEQNRQRRFLKRNNSQNLKQGLAREKRSVYNSELSQNTSSINRGFSGLESMFNRRCRILANQSVQCDLDIYQKVSEWEMHKERIDEMIKEYRKALEDLQDIRRHLNEQRPFKAPQTGLEDVRPKGGSSFLVADVDEECDCDEDDIVIGSGRKADEINTKLESKVEAQEKLQQSKRSQKRRKNECNTKNMNCFTHDNDHWKTPPYWHYGPFCFCANANNNTYWCLRTINQTHDFLYCEFITTFMSYYNLRADPFQLKNVITELNYGILQQLHEELKRLRQCKGSNDCTLGSGHKTRLPHDSDWPGLVSLKRAKFGYEDYEDEIVEEHYDVDVPTNDKESKRNSKIQLSPDYE